MQHTLVDSERIFYNKKGIQPGKARVVDTGSVAEKN